MSDQIKDQVQVTVIKGSVSTWKDGRYVKGDVFFTTRAEAEKIDSGFVQITPVQAATKVAVDPVDAPEPIVANAALDVKVAADKPLTTKAKKSRRKNIFR